MHNRTRVSWTLVTALALPACTGVVGGGGTSGGDPSSNPSSGGGSTRPGGSAAPGSAPSSMTSGALPGEDPYAIGPTGLRRLSRTEYDNAVRDLLGDPSRPGWAKLPEDAFDPFDNDYKKDQQLASAVLIDTLEGLAEDLVTRALADPARRAALIPCTPTGPADATCMRAFIAGFGRRALRRPLADPEITEYLALQSYSVEDKNFYTGVGIVMRAMLQDPEFIYQVEIGTPVASVPGVSKLNDFEVATRMSFFLVGAPPPAALLDDAQNKKLAAAPADRRAAAARLLDDPRAKDRVSWFHAQLFRYYQLPFPADLTSALRRESDTLVQKVIFEKQDYLNLFRAPETFINSLLAKHYGLPAPATASAWVPYGSNPRRGILSHGAVLSIGAKFDDTSPTLRGQYIRDYLMCDPVPPPPPEVNADEPPKSTASPCKVDRYVIHGQAGCASCHSLMDPVGFGLEAYGRDGKFRTVEAGLPQCTIKGDGQIAGVGAFNGPGQLGELLIKSGKLEPCVVRQLYRFALARRETSLDEPTIKRHADGFSRNGRLFNELLLDIASSGAFIHKRVEP